MPDLRRRGDDRNQADDEKGNGGDPPDKSHARKAAARIRQGNLISPP
jgi:hypothetical protein